MANMSTRDVAATARSKGSRPSDDQLLDGARAVIAARGLTGASMDAIAEAAGCTKPTLYAHFPSKQLIYAKALHREITQLQQWLFAAYDRATGLPAHDQTRAGMAAVFDYAKDHPDGFQLVFGTEGDGHMAAWQQFNDAVTDRVAVQIRDNLAQHGRQHGPEVTAIAAMVVGSAIFAVRHAYRHHRDNPDHILDLATTYTQHALQALSDAERTTG